MAKVKPETWDKARALLEAGKSYRETEKITGINYRTIADRAKREEWISGIKETTARRIVQLPNILYLITSEEFQGDGIYKIGITNDVEFRLKCMQTGCPLSYLLTRPISMKTL